jgi:hypothetical protein
MQDRPHTRDDRDGPVAVPLIVQRTADGDGIRMASPLLPGWVAVARGPVEISRALQVAVNEAEMARYATDRGYAYDAAPFLPEVEAPPVLRAVRRGDGTWNWRASHDPAAWTPLEDGRWRSPGGSSYGPSTWVVQRVIAARAEQGLATRHPDAPEET